MKNRLNQTNHCLLQILDKPARLPAKPIFRVLGTGDYNRAVFAAPGSGMSLNASQRG